MTTIKEAVRSLQNAGVDTLQIYFAELVYDGETDFSIDVMCDPINDICESSWVWTISSLLEVEKILKDDRYFVCADWEIITNKPFSEAAVREAISEWLLVNEIDLVVRVIDVDDATGSGYIKQLREMDLEKEIANATPLEELC